MKLEFTKVVIYARDIIKTTEFYTDLFGLVAVNDNGLISLQDEDGNEKILIHQAAKSITPGQAGVKLVFSVEDVEQFKAQARKRGVIFGATHRADGYEYANAKDPDKNNVSISSRKKA